MRSNKYILLHEEDRKLYIKRDELRWFRIDLDGGSNIQMLSGYTTTVKETPEEILKLARYKVVMGEGAKNENL